MGDVSTEDRSGYKIISSTRLNGSLPRQAEASATLASGASGNWSWEVKAVPSLLPSWQAWQRDAKIARRARPPDDWAHPAATWEQAFGRAHKLATYLLGREPLPLRLTVLLIPANTIYDESFTDSGGSSRPHDIRVLLSDDHSERCRCDPQPFLGAGLCRRYLHCMSTSTS